jgi:hypothetical protein
VSRGLVVASALLAAIVAENVAAWLVLSRPLSLADVALWLLCAAYLVALRRGWIL